MDIRLNYQLTVANSFSNRETNSSRRNYSLLRSITRSKLLKYNFRVNRIDFVRFLLSFTYLYNLFIPGERKKSVRLNTELNRSISVPADRVTSRLPGHSSAPNQTPNTPDPE